MYELNLEEGVEKQKLIQLLSSFSPKIPNENCSRNDLEFEKLYKTIEFSLHQHYTVHLTALGLCKTYNYF